jgi:hypothetical protein
LEIKERKYFKSIISFDNIGEGNATRRFKNKRMFKTGGQQTTNFSLLKHSATLSQNRWPPLCTHLLELENN